MSRIIEAAAEGMPAINRRSALVLTASGVVAAITGKAAMATATPAIDNAFENTANDFAEAMVELAETNTEFSRLSDLMRETVDICWRPLTFWSHVTFGKEVTLYSTNGANKFFDKALANVQSAGNRQSLMFNSPEAIEKHIAREIARIENCRKEAVSLLSAKEERLDQSGYNRATDAYEAAGDRAYDAFRALLHVPCCTIKQVQRKATLLITAPDGLGADLEPHESHALLVSLLGGSDGAAEQP